MPKEKQKSSISKDRLSYFWGFFSGDGSYYKVSRTKKLEFACDPKYPQIKNQWKALLEDVYLKEEVKCRDRTEKYGYIEIYVYDKWAGDFFNIPSGNKKKNGFRVPDWIYNKEEYCWMFMKGFIESDGHIHKRNYKGGYESFVCEVTNTNRRIIHPFIKASKKVACNFNIRRNQNGTFKASLDSNKRVKFLISKLGLKNKLIDNT